MTNIDPKNDPERILSEYRNSLGTCSRLPARAADKRRWRSGAGLAFGVASVAVATAVFTSWPRSAEASPMKKLQEAVRQAWSFEQICSMQLRSGRWLQYEHAYYENGKMRCEVHKGTGTSVTYVVANGQAMTDYDRLDHVTIEPADPQYFTDTDLISQDPLKMVEQQIDMGQAGIPRKTTTRQHEPVNGVPTYMIVLDRREDAYHAEILVDSRTDLPIRAEVSVQGPRDQGLLQYRMEYRFNQPLPGSLFEFRSRGLEQSKPTLKPVISLLNAENELAERWKKPLAQVDGTQIVDSSIASDGTVWIAVAARGENPALPTSLTTPDGKAYARNGIDVTPSGVLGKSHHFSLNGQPVYVVGFVPLQYFPLGNDIVTPVTVSFAQRKPHRPGYSSEPTTEQPVGRPITLQPRIEAASLPSYFTSLDLDGFSFQIPIAVLETKAQALEAKKQFVEAAHAYEECAVACRGFVAYTGARRLRLAAKDYLKAGMKAQADKANAEAQALEDSRER